MAAAAKPVEGAPQLPQGHLWTSGPGPRETSVLSHRRGNELQLEVLVLEDAVGSRATLGTTEWPVALAAAALGEFCKERQLQRSGHTSTKAVGAENVGGSGCGWGILSTEGWGCTAGRIYWFGSQFCIYKQVM